MASQSFFVYILAAISYTGIAIYSGLVLHFTFLPICGWIGTLIFLYYAKQEYRETHKQRAVSPIVATVLIIGVTLAASIAIGGFVFGIFAQGQNSAQVAVTETALSASGFTANNQNIRFSCDTQPNGSYIRVTNTGTGVATIVALSITWAGGNTAFLINTPCNVGASGSNTATMYLSIYDAKITPSAVSGQTFTGTLTLANGAQLLLTGTWQ